MKTYNLHPKWMNEPMRLTQEQTDDPILVFESFFNSFQLHEVREILWNWTIEVVSSPRSISSEANERKNHLFFYERIEAVMEAAFLFHKAGKKITGKQQDGQESRDIENPSTISMAHMSPTNDSYLTPMPLNCDPGVQGIVKTIAQICNPDKIFLIRHLNTDFPPYAFIDLLVLLPDQSGRKYEEIEEWIRDACANIVSLNLVLSNSNAVYKSLTIGHIFYTSICRPKNLLYDNKKNVLPFNLNMDCETIIETASISFKKGFQRALDFFEGAKYYQEKNIRVLASFMLSQSVILTLSAFLSSLTRHNYFSRDISRLLGLTTRITVEFMPFLYPHSTKEVKLQKLLSKAYSEARYKAGFEISEDDLLLLIEYAGRLQKMAAQEHAKYLAAFLDQFQNKTN